MNTKKSLHIVFVFILSAITNCGYSTVRDITVTNFMFSPSTISANVGDTIRWTWISGTHTTTCDGTSLTSRPAGAAPWSANMTSSTPVYRYPVTVTGTYNYKCIPHGPSGMVGVINVTAPSLSLNLTTIIEGFWNGSSMIADTVKAYLHSSVSPYSRVDSAKVRLNSSGNGVLTFTHAPSGNYYIDVRHRNALETWSKTAQSFVGGGTTNYNFTTAATTAFGDNLKLKLTKYTNYSGDVNQDGTIDGSDLSSIDNDANSFASGYIKTDVNGDNVVDGSDASIAENNAANFVTVARPSSPGF